MELMTGKGSENWTFIEQAMDSHLSKGSSDLKQNGTQEKTPFSSTVFHTLSHGVICFVVSVSSKNHLLRP